MAFRGRGRGRGFGGSDFKFVEPESFVLFPDIELPDRNNVPEEKGLALRNFKFQNYFQSSPYHLEETFSGEEVVDIERYSDKVMDISDMMHAYFAKINYGEPEAPSSAVFDDSAGRTRVENTTAADQTNFSLRSHHKRKGDKDCNHLGKIDVTNADSLCDSHALKVMAESAACGLTNNPKEQVADIDASDVDNGLAVNESRPCDYMNSQPEINDKMRAILVDWLIEVHNRFELMPETLYLTINLVDRFLSSKSVPRRELQLLGIGAMLIACSYEEIWAPEVNDFVSISERAYSNEQILKMEKAILGQLE
uniref:Cyclin-like domain-containing protein n=1 Tax=Chenopodium quinoa TaxID=63459 RepID=A0A803NA89_CHEQI